jgi:hypothetical protein
MPLKVPHSVAREVSPAFLYFLMSLSGAGGGFSNNPQSKTIVDGAIAADDELPFQLITVDTQDADPSDDLDTISGGKEGFVMILQAESSARTVVVKDGTSLKLQADFSLDNAEDKILIVCDQPSVWHELSRASNGA